MTDAPRTEEQEVATLRRLLGWVYQRSRVGCFSHKRAARDQALADVNFWTADYRDEWQPRDGRRDPNKIWCGEQP